MMKKNKKGFSIIELLIIIVVVGLLGVVGWLVYDRQKSKTSETPSTQNTQATASPQEQTPTQETKKPDPNEGYLVVKEWGLRFKTPSGLTDVKYVINGETAAFFAKPTGSSVQYRSDYDKFSNSDFEYATGELYRSKDATNNERGFAIDGKKVGSYYYYTAWSFSSLATGAACVGLYGDDSSCQPELKAFALVNGNDGNNKALLKTIELAQ
jgi:Tfp pilus assembly protein PilV